MFERIAYDVLIALALIFTSVLAGAGLIVHMSVDFTTMSEGLTKNSTNPAVTIPVAMMLLCINVSAIAIIYYRADGKKKKRYYISLLIATLFIIFIGSIWITNNMFAPAADQDEVWKMANLIAQSKGKDGNLEYFTIYPQQKAVCIAMSLFVRVFHDNGLTAYHIFSLICAALIVLLGANLAYRLSGREESGTAAAIMLAEFISIVLYTTYVYGTLPSLCFTLIAFYAVCRLMQTKRPVWIILELVGAALMYVFYTGTLIAMIAICIILLIFSVGLLKSGRRQFVIAALVGAWMPLLVAAGIRSAAGNCFYFHTGLSSKADALPASAWILMGITSDANLGPGGYDGSSVDLFYGNESNSAKTDIAAKEGIRNALIAYRNRDRSLTFFEEKTTVQWLDPWFNGLTMTVYSFSPEEMGILAPLFIPHTLERIQRCLLALMNVCYCMASLYLILQIRNKKPRLEMLLLPLYFVGGFVFQLFWETKGRYCFPYYVCLLILAGIATASLEQFLVRRYEALRYRKKLEEKASAQPSK